MTSDQLKQLPIHDRVKFFILEREAVRQKKEKCEPKPWTTDFRLLNYRFTNVVRMEDSVSIWLWSNWYGPNKDHKNIPLACILARMFNVAGAGSVLHRLTEHVFAGAPDWRKMKSAAEKCWELGPIFNSAYIVSGSKGESKLDTVLRRAGEAFRGWKFDPSSMEKSHASLLEFDGFGSFIAGQVVADLRWAWTGTWADKDVWAPPGPGSKRGIARLLSKDWRNPPDHDWYTEFKKYVWWGTGTLPRKLTNRMEAIDWQNTLCDHVDKSERLLWGEGRTKSRYPGAG